MKKKTEDQLIVEKLVNYYFSPYTQNVIVNANDNVQKGIIEGLGTGFDVYNDKVFHTININGRNLFNDLRQITKEMESFCNKKGLEYEEINKEYYQLQNTNIEAMSVEELSNFVIALWEVEKRRNKDLHSRVIMRAIYERYFMSKIAISVKEIAIQQNLGKISYILDEMNINELLEFQAMVKSGDIESVIGAGSMLNTYYMANMCRDLYSNNNGFITIIENGENIIDYDLHDPINILMSQRTSALSVSFMTRLQHMYSYYTTGPGRLFLEETHDVRTTDVKRLVLNNK